LANYSVFARRLCRHRLRDWQAGVTDDRSTMYALTTNDSGNVLGEWCSLSSGDCTWMLGLTTDCEQESSYPVLANTDTLAAPLTIKCGGKIEDSQLSRYQFSNFKDIAKLLKKPIESASLYRCRGTSLK
jgi:hypothetical protein